MKIHLPRYQKSNENSVQFVTFSAIYFSTIQGRAHCLTCKWIALGMKQCSLCAADTGLWSCNQE